MRGPLPAGINKFPRNPMPTDDGIPGEFVWIRMNRGARCQRMQPTASPSSPYDGLT